MGNDTHTVDLHVDALSSDIAWEELYSSLFPFARSLVFSFKVPAWCGQEDDIAQDVVQETARRLIERLRKAERGELPPVQSVRAMMFVIARNYCRDMRRGDLHLTRIMCEAPAPGTSQSSGDDQVTFADVAVENVFEESLFLLVAREIARFPCKQCRALLIDLASRMALGGEPTALQRAFLEVGIQLQDYQNLRSDHLKERRNRTSLSHYAYRRVGHMPLVQEYVSA